MKCVDRRRPLEQHLSVGALMATLLIAVACGRGSDSTPSNTQSPTHRGGERLGQAGTVATLPDTLIIQVASYRDASNAQREKRKLSRRWRSVYVERTEIPHRGTWYRLRLGPFASRSAADSTLALLNRLGYAEAYEVTVRAAPVDVSVVTPGADSAAGSEEPQRESSVAAEIRLTETGNSMRPRWSPRGREIAFFASPQGRSGLYAVGSGGGPLLPLVVASDSIWPTPKYEWSPSAGEIAFVALEEIPWGRRTRKVENLWLVVRQGGAAHRLTRQESYPFEIEALAWSPSGKWLAFNADFGGQDAYSDRIQDVRVIEVATGATMVVSQEGTGWTAGWLDDQRLLFLQTYDRTSSGSPFTYEVWSLDLRNQLRERVVSGAAVHNCRELRYLPSRNTLLYSRFNGETPGSFYVDAIVALDLTTGQDRIVVKADRRDRLSADFALSATGGVAFVRSGGVWFTDLDGAEPKLVMPSASQPHWSPGGEDLVCIRQGDLFRIRLAKKQSFGVLVAPGQPPWSHRRRDGWGRPHPRIGLGSDFIHSKRGG